MQRINILPEEQAETIEEQGNRQNPPRNTEEEQNRERDSVSNNSVSITPREQASNRRR